MYNILHFQRKDKKDYYNIEGNQLICKLKRLYTLIIQKRNAVTQKHKPFYKSLINTLNFYSAKNDFRIWKLRKYQWMVEATCSSPLQKEEEKKDIMHLQELEDSADKFYTEITDLSTSNYWTHAENIVEIMP